MIINDIEFEFALHGYMYIMYIIIMIKLNKCGQQQQHDDEQNKTKQNKTAMPNPLDRVAQRIADSSEEREHVGEHGVLVHELCRDGVGEHLPGACVGPRLQGRLRLHLLRQHHPPPRMVQLG